MKKISKFMKNNKVETGLYTITLLSIMELLVTGRILIEYDKGGSIKSLLDKKINNMITRITFNNK